MKIQMRISKDLAITAIGFHLLNETKNVNKGNFKGIIAEYVQMYGTSCMDHHDAELESNPIKEDQAIQLVDRYFNS